MEVLCAPSMELLYAPRKTSAHIKHEVGDFYGLGTMDQAGKGKTASTSSTLDPTKSQNPIQQEKPKEKSSFRKSLSNFLTPPATKSYNKVLASTYAKEQSTKPYQHSLGSEDSLAKEKEEANQLTDEEKAKRLVAERDASHPTGNFMLGTYRPLAASMGYEDYYTAKGMTGK